MGENIFCIYRIWKSLINSVNSLLVCKLWTVQAKMTSVNEKLFWLAT